MQEFELVVPAYNEAKNLSTLLDRAIDAAKNAGFDANKFKLVLVENGSTDESKQVLSELLSTERREWVRVVTVPVNQGYGFGLWAGLSSTTSPYVGWSHADLQCDTADAFIALTILKAANGTKHLVKGIREGRNWKDIFVSRVFETLAWLISGVHVKEMNAQPKIFPRELLTHLKNPPKTFALDLYLLYQAARQGYKPLTLTVLFPPRVHGMSKWAASFMGRYKTILGIIRYMITLARAEGRL